MDFSTFKKKLERADVLLAAKRATRNDEIRESLSSEILGIIDDIVREAKQQSGNSVLVLQMLGSVLSDESYDLGFEHALIAYHFMRRTKA